MPRHLHKGCHCSFLNDFFCIYKVGITLQPTQPHRNFSSGSPRPGTAGQCLCYLLNQQELQCTKYPILPNSIDHTGLKWFKMSQLEIAFINKTMPFLDLGNSCPFSRCSWVPGHISGHGDSPKGASPRILWGTQSDQFHTG